VPAAPTIADGISVRRVGEHTLTLAQRFLDDVVTVSEEEIANAILLLLEIEKTVVEGAGAVALAALINKRVALEGKTVVLLLGGGNIDVNLIARIIERGLVKDGRIVRLTVLLRDRPGSLARLTGLVAAAAPTCSTSATTAPSRGRGSAKPKSSSRSRPRAPTTSPQSSATCSPPGTPWKRSCTASRFHGRGFPRAGLGGVPSPDHAESHSARHSGPPRDFGLWLRLSAEDTGLGRELPPAPPSTLLRPPLTALAAVGRLMAQLFRVL